MPKAAWCDVDNQWVWVNDDGTCVNGHGPEHLTRVYDTDTQNAPPPPPPVAPPPPVGYAIEEGGPSGQQTYPAAPPVPPGQPYQPYQPQPSPWQAPAATASRDRSTLSLVLGILSILCCIPIISLPCAIGGLVFGIQSLKGPKRGLAIAGIVLSGIGLAASIVNASLGAYFGLTGQNEFVNQFLNR